MLPAVIDTTVLSNFAHTGKPLLLAAAFDTPVTSPAVIKELAAGVERMRLPDVDWSWLTVIALSEAEQLNADRLSQTLGRGEAECIALALARGWMVLTDDRDARQAARRLNVVVSGTLGALMNLVHGQHLTLVEGDHLLTVMKEHGYRAPIHSLSELLPPGTSEG